MNNHSFAEVRHPQSLKKSWSTFSVCELKKTKNFELDYPKENSKLLENSLTNKKLIRSNSFDAFPTIKENYIPRKDVYGRKICRHELKEADTRHLFFDRKDNNSLYDDDENYMNIERISEFDDDSSDSEEGDLEGVNINFQINLFIKK